MSKCSELYGDMPLDQQSQVLAPSTRRKIILATNVAETSITIPGVTAVIDSGTARIMRQDFSTGLNRLEIERISKASAAQRAGRAGRTAPGVCIRLWGENEQRGLADFDTPEIRRVDLSGAILELLAWGEPDAKTFPWYESPTDEAFKLAMTQLRRLGAIDSQQRITTLGKQMVQLPLQPRIARLLIAGQEEGLLEGKPRCWPHSCQNAIRLAVTHAITGIHQQRAALSVSVRHPIIQIRTCSTDSRRCSSGKPLTATILGWDAINKMLRHVRFYVCETNFCVRYASNADSLRTDGIESNELCKAKR